MHWQVLIIPLIAFAVWILSNLLKEPEPPPKDRPRGDWDPSRPRRTPAEIERFLAQQRQRRAEAERPREAITQPVPPADRPPRERPARPQPRPPEPRRPAREREAGLASRPAPRRPVPVPVPIPVPLPVKVADRPTPTAVPPAPPTPVAQPVSVAAPAPPVEATPASPVQPAAQTPAATVNPAGLPTLSQLLRTPQAARLAFILREIIDPPLCRRPRHPHS